MKIRNGFISNSSSSSFIVAFPREMKSEKEVKDLLGNPNEDVIRTIWGAIKNNQLTPTPYILRKLLMEVEMCEDDGLNFPDARSFLRKDGTMNWKKYDKAFVERTSPQISDIVIKHLIEKKPEDTTTLYMFNAHWEDEEDIIKVLTDKGIEFELWDSNG